MKQRLSQLILSTKKKREKPNKLCVEQKNEGSVILTEIIERWYSVKFEKRLGDRSDDEIAEQVVRGA